MQILIVFVMYLGSASVQVEIVDTQNECRAIGREMTELLKEHKHIKDVQWQCIAVKDVGKPT